MLAKGGVNDSFNSDHKSIDDDDNFMSYDADKDDRLGFIRKVYGILSVQLCLTASAITAVKVIPGWNEAIQTPGMTSLCLGLLLISIVIEFAIICCKDVSRRSP